MRPQTDGPSTPLSRRAVVQALAAGVAGGALLPAMASALTRKEAPVTQSTTEVLCGKVIW